MGEGHSALVVFVMPLTEEVRIILLSWLQQQQHVSLGFLTYRNNLKYWDR